MDKYKQMCTTIHICLLTLFIRMIKMCIFCRPRVLQVSMGKYGASLVFFMLIQTIFGHAHTEVMLTLPHELFLSL